jgi:hypothetical protein
MTEGRDSLLSGSWWHATDGLNTLDYPQINNLIQIHTDWTGLHHFSSLRTAFVTHRSGAFAEHDDALYYATNFKCTDSMPEYDILDIVKLEEIWRRRLPYLEVVMHSKVIEYALEHGHRILTHANNEYHCHEGGHRLGSSIESKCQSGYFRPMGRLIWPLVFVEEHRADLLSLDFALRLLSGEHATLAFLYQILHRFGLASFSRLNGKCFDGAVPYLLFCKLLELGLIATTTENGRPCIAFCTFDYSCFSEAMNLLVGDVRRDLVNCEIESNLGLDMAINAMCYYRRYTHNESFLRAWNSVFGHVTT